MTSVLAERPDAVLVEMGLPYWQPPPGACQAYLATYGATRANAEAAAELLGLVAAGLGHLPGLSRTYARSALAFN